MIDRTASMCRRPRQGRPAPTWTTPRTASARCSASSTRRTPRSGCWRSRRCRRPRRRLRPVQRDPSTPAHGINGDLLGYDGYDTATRGYLTDRSRPTTRPVGNLDTTSGLYLHSMTAATRHVHRGRRQHLVQRGAAPGPGRAPRRTAAPNVPNYIVFLTDGEANIGSVYSKSDRRIPQNGIDDQQPCQAAINAAARSRRPARRSTASASRSAATSTAPSGTSCKKSANGNWATACTTGTNGCYHYASDNGQGEPGDHLVHHALEIASCRPTSTTSPTPVVLDTAFSAIATDIGSGSSRLVTDGF